MRSLCCKYGLESHQYNIVNAFVEAHLDELVYCRMPAGFPKHGISLKLLRALGGFRISPKLWYNHIAAFFLADGLTACKEDRCIFKRGKFIVFFYGGGIVVM